jgi:hypothetical protein
MTNYPELLEKLRASREDFLAAVRGVTDAQAAVNPSGGGWSIVQCVEHVATAETALFQRLSMERIPLPDGPPRNLEAAILGRGADRSRKFDAPESYGRPAVSRRWKKPCRRSVMCEFAPSPGWKTATKTSGAARRRIRSSDR